MPVSSYLCVLIPVFFLSLTLAGQHCSKSASPYAKGSVTLNVTKIKLTAICQFFVTVQAGLYWAINLPINEKPNWFHKLVPGLTDRNLNLNVPS